MNTSAPTSPRRNLLRNAGRLAAAGLATLVLMYGIENVRGWYPWKQQRDALLARGEKLWPADFFPGAIPDDENFALIPALKPLFDFDPSPARTNRWRDPKAYQGVMRLFELPGGERGAPNPWPNEGAGDWLRGQRVDLARFQAAFRNPPSPTPGSAELRKRYGLSPQPSDAKAASPGDPPARPVLPMPETPGTPATDVLAALGHFAADFRAIEEGLKRPRCRFPIQYGDGYATLLPHLAIVKKIVLRFRLRAAARLAAGDTAGALDDVEAMLRLAETVEVEPFLISQLVRGASYHYALQPVWEGLVSHAWSEPQLARLEARLAAIDFLRDVRRSLRAERAGLVELTADIASSSSGRRRYRELAADFGATGSDPLGIYLALAPRGWFYANLDVSSRAFESLIDFDPARPETVQARWKAARDAAPPSIRLLLHHRYFFDAGIGQGLNRSVVNCVRIQTLLRLGATALGLERQRLAGGTYPATLEDLESRFRPASPPGLAPLQPLRYQPDGPGRFRLWTDGDDGENNDGTWPPRATSADDYRPAPDASGDWVWRWPADG